MQHTLIETSHAQLAIANVGATTRAAARTACDELIETMLANTSVREPHISKAHSGGWIAVGIAAHADIGVDVEVARPRERLPQIAALLDLDGTSEDAFFTHWTLRESLAKCVGGSVLQQEDVEPQLLAAGSGRETLVTVGCFAALCGRLDGGIYYSLVLKSPAPDEAIRCA